MKRVVVLGSTGSIGTQTLDVIARHPDRFEVVGLAAGRNESLLNEQSARFPKARTVLYERDGMAALEEMAALPAADVIVLSVAGVIGLRPAMAAIAAGKDVALASKEVLVAAGEPVMAAVREKGVKLTPIDSEHSALFQCLQGPGAGRQVRRLILTASGGPFRGRSLDSLRAITVQEALNHPTWRMGGKITIDSATLMNKGLEIIEARWLFDVPEERIEAVVHPQSVVHSMVEFGDGSVLGQMGWPDMRLPILYALAHPDREPSGLRPWNPVETPCLTFEPPDTETFESLGLARRALRMGGTAPAALNAANEEAANAFLRGEIAFLRIPEIVRETLDGHTVLPCTLENVLATDAAVRASLG